MSFLHTAISRFAETSLLIGIILSLFLPLRSLLRRFVGSQWLCVLWVALLIRLLLPWPLESPLGLINRWQRSPARSLAGEPWKIKVSAVETGDVETAPPNIQIPSASAASPSTPTPLDLPCIAWEIGVIFSLGLLAWRCNRTRRLAKKTQPASDERLLRIFASIPQKWRLNICLRMTVDLKVPTLAGVIHPQIWMPRAWPAQFTDGELRNILLHELGHARRGDLLVQWLFAFAQCIHWFNPLVCIAARAARFDREMACDAWVLARTDAETSDYGAVLMKTIGMLLPTLHTSSVTVAMASSRKSLRTRISAIGAFRPISKWRGMAGIVIMSVFLAMMTTSRMGGQETSSPAAAAKSPEVTTGSPTVAISPISPAPDSDKKPTNNPPGTYVRIETRLVELSDSLLLKLGNRNPFFKKLLKVMPEPSKNAAQENPAALQSRSSPFQLIDFPDLSAAQLQKIAAELNQVKGVDLVTSPRVTVLSGKPGEVEIIREFRYPTAFEPDSKRSGVLTPIQFETKKIGATLDITPRVRADGQTIDTHLALQFVEFLGFRLPYNPREPVFSTSKIETQTSLVSGQTSIFGSWRQDRQQINDSGKITENVVGTLCVAFVTLKIADPNQAAEASASPIATPPHKHDPNSKIPYAIPVKGKEGFVTSPFSPQSGEVDVRGFPMNTQVKDPYTGKLFLVP